MARQPRADAVRNRGRILAAAREQIAQHGPDVGMDAIAIEAGVAVGTLYRHFPTKEDLVTAIVDELMDGVADQAETALAHATSGAPAGDELTSFLRSLMTASAENQAAKAAAAALGASHGPRAAEARVTAAITALIATGHRDGSIPPGVSVDDVYLLAGTAPYTQPPAVRERWLDLVLTGLMTVSEGAAHQPR